MLVDDEITLGITLRGEIENYESLKEISHEFQKLIDYWIIQNVSGNFSFWVDNYD